METLSFAALLLLASLAVLADSVKLPPQPSYPLNEDNSGKPLAPVVDLDAFQVQGFVETTESGFDANVYLGIPYAQPPVDELRFEKPQPPKRTGQLLKTINYGSPCHPQVDQHPDVRSSEDCLHLNVFAPADAGDKKYPVLLFIHGGGFNYEFSEVFHYTQFVKHLVAKGLVVVTLNYRLTFFGFLATRDGGISPNIGLWDQQAALQLVKGHIAKFGGDAEHITIWGHSAGSASVHAHMLSPHSRDLFHAVIQCAGSLNAYWGTGTKLYDYSDMLIQELQCARDTGAEVKQCLQGVDHRRFWAATKNLGFKEMTPGMDTLYWNPVMDIDFFDGKSWQELTAETTPKPLYYGVDAAEGLIFTMNSGHPITSPYAARQGIKSEYRKYFSRVQIESYFINVLLDPAIKNRDIISDELCRHYDILDDADEATSLHNFKKYTECISTYGIDLPSLIEVQENAKNGYTDQYLYVFNYTRPSDVAILGNEPPHGYEWLFVLAINAYTFETPPFNQTDYRVQKALVDSIVNFAKTWDPSIDGVTVPRMTADTMPYLHIAGDEIGVKQGYYESELQFWTNLAEKYNLDPVTMRIQSGSNPQKLKKDEF